MPSASFTPARDRGQAKSLNTRKPRLHHLKARDDWMRAILADSDLPLTTRVVGAYLGFLVGVTDDAWPSIYFDDEREIIKGIAAAIGLPRRVVALALVTLIRRRYIDRHRGCYDIGMPIPVREGGRS
jgi:hypothetical protein